MFISTKTYIDCRIKKRVVLYRKVKREKTFHFELEYFLFRTWNSLMLYIIDDIHMCSIFLTLALMLLIHQGTEKSYFFLFFYFQAHFSDRFFCLINILLYLLPLYKCVYIIYLPPNRHSQHEVQKKSIIQCKQNHHINANVHHYLKKAYTENEGEKSK